MYVTLISEFEQRVRVLVSGLTLSFGLAYDFKME